MFKSFSTLNQIFSRRQNCFCAFCKTPRKVYKKPKMGLVQITLPALTALGLMLAIWHDFHPMVFVFFTFIMLVTEIFLQLRWRSSLICKHCGFDPIVYLKEPKKAAETVRVKLEARKNDPQSLLGPALNLPRRPKESVRSGSQVNRVI